ncbi:hypothetical protein TPA0910_47760 [Streptomyces hygroscopicus subsp. sporocinereus]|uniref:Secreted protein n=1 Tax=Streptomyces hygroscopicus TaxID=1912 RepID=A0ABQ3U421_STRHY|nr:hypothetical protein TPA0910_47760 [Streptomyces hygroscopicus]
MVLEPWQVTAFLVLLLVLILFFPDDEATSTSDVEPALVVFGSSWEDAAEAEDDVPSLRVPEPSLHAVRERAPIARAAAVVRRRVREVRRLDMWVSPFGGAVGVVLG